jgi:probable F420-dependent oxidoreductase
MKLGVVFPQTEIGNDPTAIRDYAQAVDEAGFEHLIAYDHVLGAPVARFAGVDIGRPRPPYTEQSAFHEVFVLFGFLAAATRRVELATGVLILPQRQTALVAKQTAAVDVLSGGRFRLGIGSGWNFVEYEALGEDFHTRGRRLAEQVALLRRLWTEPLVDFEGRWDQIKQAGINPLPVQRPIPIWMGGAADVVLRRIAETADGWFAPGAESEDAADQAVYQVRARWELAPDRMSRGGVRVREPGAASGSAATAERRRGRNAHHRYRQSTDQTADQQAAEENVWIHHSSTLRICAPPCKVCASAATPSASATCTTDGAKRAHSNPVSTVAARRYPAAGSADWR